MNLSRRIYRKAHYAFNDLLFDAGLDWPLKMNRTGKRMMVYHGVDSVGSLAYNTRFISERLLEQQVIYFKKNFHLVSLSQYYEGNLPNDKLTICLTFDDGYANNFTRVLPILEKHQVPATFFITAIRAKGYAYLWTDYYDMLRFSVNRLEYQGKTYRKNNLKNFISQESGEPLNRQLRQLSFDEIEDFIRETTLKTGLKMTDFPDDYHLQMTAEQIKTMAQSPFATIGSHTSTHADVTVRPMDEAMEEMRFSKEWLENTTQKEIEAFAFPYGVYTAETVKAAQSAGYRYLLPCELNNEADAQWPELQKRFGNNPFLSLKNQIWCILNEKYL
ncbi:MAG: polysaccharide deacetylase family protein [Spirosomataceae bacterium]